MAGELKNRVRYPSTVSKRKLDDVREISNETRIPTSKLMDEALGDLVKKYKRSDEKLEIGQTVVLAIMNYKGGCGKTSVAQTLIYDLSEKGYKVLAIDADMQYNLTNSYDFAISPNNITRLLLEQNIDPFDVIVKSSYENIDFIISDPELAMIDLSIAGRMQREYILKKSIDKIVESGRYDFIIFDTNPYFGILNLNVAVASDFIIIPVECSDYGIQGIEGMRTLINQAKDLNPKLEILGAFCNIYDSREKVTKVCAGVVQDVFSDVIMNAIIHRDTNVKQAQLLHKPLPLHNPKCKAAIQFQEFTEEVLSLVEIKLGQRPGSQAG